MAIDWDGQVFRPVASVFGEPVTYIPATGLPFAIVDAIFEEQYRRVDMLDDGSYLTTEQPALTVRLAAFPAGSTPRQNDRVRVASKSATYVTREVQLDNHGLAKLMLQEVGKAP